MFDFARSWGQWAARVLTGLADGDHSRAIALGDLIGYDLVAGRFDPASPVIAGTAGQIAALLRPALPGWDQASLVACLNAEAARCDMAPAVPLVPLMARLRARGLRIGLMTNDGEVLKPVRIWRQRVSWRISTRFWAPIVAMAPSLRLRLAGMRSAMGPW